MICKECGVKLDVVRNDSQSQVLPFTTFCPQCKKWWDCSPINAADIKGIPLNLVGKI